MLTSAGSVCRGAISASTRSRLSDRLLAYQRHVRRYAHAPQSPQGFQSETRSSLHERTLGAVKNILESRVYTQSKTRKIQDVLDTVESPKMAIFILNECGKKSYRFNTEPLAGTMGRVLRKRQDSLEVNHVCLGIYAMHQWDFKNADSRHLFAALVANLGLKVQSGRASAKAIGQGLYGIQKMNDRFPMVLDFLEYMCGIIPTCNERLCEKTLASSIYGLRNMSAKTFEVRALLSLLEKQLTTCNNELGTQGMGRALYGLQNMSAESAEVRGLLSALEVNISKSDQRLRPKEIAMSLYGLQNMSAESAEVRGLLSVLKEKVSTCEETLNPQGIGMSLYGLQNMSAESAEVRGLLSALEVNISKSDQKLRPKEIAMSLYGLQNMSAESAEVRGLLTALLERVSTCEEPLNNQEIGMSLYGLQKMSAESAEVRSLLSVLKEEALASRQSFAERFVGMSLYGLQNMSAESAEVRSLLSALAMKVSTCEEALSAQSVSNALYGLQNMNAESLEVQELLRVILEKMSGCQEELSDLQFGMSLSGMQNMSLESAEVQALKNVLDSRAKSQGQKEGPEGSVCNMLSWTQLILGLCSFPVTEKTSQLMRNLTLQLGDALKQSASLQNERSLASALRLLVGLRLPLFVSLPRDIQKDIEELLAVLTSRRGTVAIAQDVQNSSERYFSNLAEQALADFRQGELSITVQKNIDLYDFEVDILVTVTSEAPGQHLDFAMNFEIDGPNHRYAKKKRFCSMRDQYLSQVHDIRIKRIDCDQLKRELIKVRKMRQSEYADTIMKYFRDAVEEEVARRRLGGRE